VVLRGLFLPFTFALEFEWFFYKKNEEKMDRIKTYSKEYQNKCPDSFVAFLFNIFSLDISNILLNTHTHTHTHTQNL
jgi:hypothetical protein